MELHLDTYEANRSKARKPSAQKQDGYLLTITWHITGGMSVERAEALCRRDAAKVLPEVRRRRPVKLTAEPAPAWMVTP